MLSALTVYLKENTAMLIVVAAALVFSALLFWSVSALPIAKWMRTLGVKLRLVDEKREEGESPLTAQPEKTSDKKKESPSPSQAEENSCLKESIKSDE